MFKILFLRFTNARLLYDRLDEKLEWKHGKTYVPKGNKKLLCLIDDINLSQVCNFCYLKCQCYTFPMNSTMYYANRFCIF